MDKIRPQLILITGLMLIITLFGGLAFTTLWRVGHIIENIHDVTLDHATQLQLANTMRHAGRERSLLLVQMATTDDPFLQDELRTNMLAEGARFLQARQALKMTPLDQNEKRLLAELSKRVTTVYPLQEKVIEHIEAGELQRALEIVTTQTIPFQDLVLRLLDQLSDLQLQQNHDELTSASKQHHAAIIEISVVALLASGIALAIGWYVTARISRLLHHLKKSGEHLRDNAARERAIRDKMTDGMVTTDAQGIIINCNPAIESLLGYVKSELLGQTISLFIPNMTTAAHDAHMQRYLHTGKSRIMGTGREIQARHKDGTLVDIDLGISHIQRGDESLFVAILHDISQRKQIEKLLQEHNEQLEREVQQRTSQLEAEIQERKRAEEKLETLASQDMLTGLPNRFQFNKQLAQSLAYAKRHDEPLALLFLDLDGFKAVNDEYGHRAGDLLLKQVAERLVNSLREEDLVARLGGDEFTVLVRNIADQEALAIVAEKLVDALAIPFGLDGQQANIGASIGISHYPRDGKDAETLLAHADAAMYEAKSLGKNGFCFYRNTLLSKSGTS